MIVHAVNYGDQSELVSHVMSALLLKLGGQITFTMEELVNIRQEFPAVRIARVPDPTDPSNPNVAKLVCTLMSARATDDTLKHLGGNQP